MTDQHRPGSNGAIAEGCICPIADNGHGAGVVINGKRSWWYAFDCPYHASGTPAPDESVTTEEERDE